MQDLDGRGKMVVLISPQNVRVEEPGCKDNDGKGTARTERPCERGSFSEDNPREGIGEQDRDDRAPRRTSGLAGSGRNNSVQ